MADPPNFVLVPDPEPEAPSRPAPPLVGQIRRFAALLGSWLSSRTAAITGPEPGLPAAWSGRAGLVFGFDATASREPAWAAARQVTDALVQALPGELDVALAVHGGGRLHTFTAHHAWVVFDHAHPAGSPPALLYA
jgi:hypothetical protein